MPGAWEYGSPDVLVAILTRGVVPTSWAVSLRDLQLGPSSKIIFLTGMPFDHARNAAAAQALAGGFQWLFFLDDDVLPPANCIERLKSVGQDIVSGLYYRRHIPVMPVALRKAPDGSNQYVTDFSPGQVVPVDLVGGGCLLIHRRVLEAIKKPWFEWLCDREDLQEKDRVSEDYAFCDKARQHGFKIVLDTMVQCRHAGYGVAKLGGHFEPLSI